MKGSVVQALIWSDWHRHRAAILFSIVGGGLALALVQFGGEVMSILGATWFFVALIVLGCMMPVSNVVNDRKRQVLPFLMSLPLSITQYTKAKLVSTVGMFLVPWVTLVIGAVSFIAMRKDIPNGMIPILLILSMVTLVGFCVIAAVAMVSESEGWTIAATVMTNSSYGFSWYLLARNAAIREGMGAASPVWGPEVVTVLGVEAALVVGILGLTFFLQSRKRDFV